MICGVADVAALPVLRRNDMPTKKRAASHDVSRLKILAAGGEDPYREYVAALLASGDRMAREAALEALIERPLPKMREQLRALYFDIDADSEKRDPGAHVRTGIAQVLVAGEDPRDIDIALRAVDTREKSMGADCTANLRALGLRIIAKANPELFPFVAVEHVNDSSTFSPEPANTALQLLASTGHEASVYQWIVTGVHEPALLEAAIDLLHDAPALVMSRCLAQLTRDAIESQDEPLLTKLAETIVEREFEDAYASLASVLDSPVSKELYGYLALLLAGTNRPPLLAILGEQMERDIRRRPAIIDALRVRTTPEQAVLLKRWEDGD
jgi:hypothetical protein